MIGFFDRRCKRSTRKAKGAAQADRFMATNNTFSLRGYNMKNEELDQLISRLEVMAKDHPARYTFYVISVALLGFAILGVAILSSLLSVALLVGLALLVVATGGKALILVAKLGKLLILLA